MKLKSENNTRFTQSSVFHFIPKHIWGALLAYLFGVLLFSSCSGTRHLPEGEKLYTGAQIKVISTDKFDTKKLEANALSVARPEPNASILGMRPKLLLYKLGGKNPSGKLKNWFRKVGEAPVLLSNTNPAVTVNIIDALLFNDGIFNGYTSYEIVEKKRTAKLIYTSYVHKPYVFDSLTYEFDIEKVASKNISLDSIKADLQIFSDLIIAEKDKSLIVKGRNYSLNVLENERLRIDAILKNKGYFFFNPDYLLFEADSTSSDFDVKLKLTLKEDVPASALKAFRIGNVVVNQNYSLNDDAGANSKDTVMFKQAIFVGNKEEMNISTELIERSIYLKKEALYTRENHNITLNRLMSLGNFKFVQVKFANNDTISDGLLDVEILMTPMPNFSFRAEMDLITKSNNYSGPRMNLSFMNRNAFKGAELLKFDLAGSFEAQLGGSDQNLFSYNLSPQVALTFPRIWAPFNIKNTQSLYTPKTNISLSYNYVKRVDYFDMQAFQFAYGYKWKNNIKNEHIFSPITISNNSIRNESEKFADLLLANSFLRKSYEEQFIGGASYSFTYNEQMLQKKSFQFYFNGTAETAGNVFSLLNLVGGKTPNAENPSTLLGSVYSQFAKLSIDGRMYYNFSNGNKTALRMFVGTAKSYGNSSTLPYSKQFFSGGPNSIRAFNINSLGPGNYLQSAENTGFLQLGGDIKLEMNAEYRFDIYSFLKGALFIDAGNVWQQQSNPSNLGTPFALNGFMNELAVGAGIGLRVDVSFFVVRFDLATPLRKPWLPDNQRWVINQFKPLDARWREENLLLNIAIGYPF